MVHWLHNHLVWFCLAAAATGAVWAAPVRAQETDWLPTPSTHCWARFGLSAWREVRICTSSFDEQEREIRSSTTIARTRLVRIAMRSFSLCVTTTLEAAGHEFTPEPQEITRDLAPELVSSKVLRNETLEIGDTQYPVQVIQLVTRDGSRHETSEVYYCQSTSPQTLRRVTTSVEGPAPGVTTGTKVEVTELDKMRTVLGKTECTWCVTTVIEKGDRRITIREIQCEAVPGELVSQVTEERTLDGKLLSRREMELLAFGHGRLRRLFHRNR